jgi:NAD(P)-dependent dehydrogenase (short-subunit alcohol dehydrogenase family)
MANKIAYVTGGMGGIGTAICRKFHDAGYTVIAGCGPTRDFEKWLAEQKADGYYFSASVGNVADWESTKDAFDKVKAEHRQSDILVNNAGITRDGMFRKMSRRRLECGDRSTNLNSHVQRHQAGARRHAREGVGAASSTSRRSTARRASSARPTTPPPRPACTASRWRWPRKSPTRA